MSLLAMRRRQPSYDGVLPIGTEYYCVICRDSIQCEKCRANYFQDLAYFWEHRVNVLLDEPEPHFEFRYWDIADIESYFRLSNTFIPNIFTELSHLEYPKIHFVTLTFDPAKFRLINTTCEQQRTYILKSIYDASDNTVYGCFEHHDSGIVHAHYLIRLENNTISAKKYYQKIKCKFTNNVHNKRAVTLLPAKFPQAINYIQKESIHYFYHEKPIF